MRRERRISRKALVRRFMTSCTIVGVISLAVGIVIGIIIGSHTTITAEASADIPSDESADVRIVLETEPVTEPVTELVTESVTEPETAAAEMQQNEPECCETETESMTKLIQLSAEEEETLLKLAMAEAESEGVEGKALVMDVVLNRVESASFPDSVEDVVFQRKQFSPISDGRYYKVTPDEECYEALELVEAGWDESQGATYFCAGNSNWHNNNLTKLFKNGSHTFYK